MSDLRKAAEKVLNIISEKGQYGIDESKVILKKALEQPQQEPKGWVVEEDGVEEEVHRSYDDARDDVKERYYAAAGTIKISPLYTHPDTCSVPNVHRLSDDELENLVCYYTDGSFRMHPEKIIQFYEAIMDACNIPKEGE